MGHVCRNDNRPLSFLSLCTFCFVLGPFRPSRQQPRHLTHINPLWQSDAIWRRQHVVQKHHIFHYERIPSNLRCCDFLKKTSSSFRIYWKIAHFYILWVVHAPVQCSYVDDDKRLMFVFLSMNVRGSTNIWKDKINHYMFYWYHLTNIIQSQW